MDQLARSCFDAAVFPKNLIDPWTYDHSLEKYVERLDQNQSRLFYNESKAAVEVLELEDQGKGFQDDCILRIDQLKDKFRFPNLHMRKDPLCRFIFIHAPNARKPLKTTREMLMFALTYHQVMPAYLDFIFPFGDQVYPQDFFFSGFRHENRLSQVDRGLSIPELGRSGRGLQLCYNLKSVEPSKDEWPWSIRQTAVYHSFDIESGRTIWIMVKGNRLMKRRIQEAINSNHHRELASFQSANRAFASSLGAHLILCDWAGENWRWYINFLEEAIQDRTGHALRVPLERRPSPSPERPVRSETAPPMKRQPTRLSGMFPYEKIRRAFTHNVDTPSNPMLNNGPAPAALPEKSPESVDQQQFSFSDLQVLQYLEEKANDTLLVLEMNANVLSELKQEYRSITESEDWPDELKLNCKGDVSRFERRISNVINDLQMQRSRLETLLRLLAQRRSLLYGILEYRNMEANKHLAQKTQVVTHEMHEIAKKTERETVSMKIITLVTLFFLPGTFISTFMSTDIIRFPPIGAGEPPIGTGKTAKTFSFAALKLFIAISLPLMFLTFLAWWIVYKWVNRKDRVKLEVSSKV